jgi:PTS system N-acetylglucosamine-specific IIC component
MNYKIAKVPHRDCPCGVLGGLSEMLWGWQNMYLQRLGKALMLPVSCMPICALLMGIGYCMCPAAMQGGEITGVVASVGYFLIRAGSALLDHIAWLFAIGVGIGMAEDNNGTGALAALVSWLMIITLLNVDTISVLLPSLAENSNKLLAFSKIENPFIGILSGIIGSTCYNRFHKTKLPDWLSFFSGKRTVAIVAGVYSVAVSFILLLVWPLVFSGLTALGHGIEGLGPAGAGIYAFLNRLLIPFGLHHALNNVFWFDTIGLGDLTHFWAGETSADVSWSLGMYMSGFFPCMMFGVPAACLAIVKCAKPERRKAVMGIMLSSALCSFVCGVTEPFEFSFMFLAPVLYVIYALLYGIITYITVITGFRAGFSFSGGITDLVFSASLPAASKIWLIIPLGVFTSVLFYLVFRLMIVKCNLKILGREDDEAENVPSKDTSSLAKDKTSHSEDKTNPSEKKAISAEDKYAEMARMILKGLGGAQNLISIDNCITRLRLEIKDMNLVDDAVIRSSGALAVVRPGKNSLQVVIGTRVQFVADELKALCSD